MRNTHEQNQVASFAYEDIAVWAAATIGKASVNPGDKSQGKTCLCRDLSVQLSALLYAGKLKAFLLYGFHVPTGVSDDAFLYLGSFRCIFACHWMF